MTDEPLKPELAAELEDLRARLAEAEDVLRAVRNGEVDAVVVAGERGEQVYTLRGADRVYRQLIETMSEGAVALSANGVILYCNVRLAEMLERPLDHVLGTALRDHLPTADQQALDAILAQARTGPSRREISLTTSEGRLVPVHLSASRLHREGAETGFCLVLTDLTEQKRHEQTSVAERLARLILEQAAEAIVVCDEGGRIIRASHAAQRFCDDSPLLRPFAEVFPLRTVASEPFHLAPVIQGETLRNVDVTLDRQGQKLDLILNAGQLLSGQKILGCIVTLTNITERKQSERALKESEEIFRVIFEDSKDGIILVDVESKKIHASNKTFCDMLQYTLNEIRQLGVVDIHPEEILPRVYEAFEKTMKQGSELADNISIRRKDGSIFWADIKSSPVTISGKKYVLGNFRDVTERRKAEETLGRLGMAVEQAAETVIITDREGMIQYANPAFERISGYSREEVVGKNPETLLAGKQDVAFYQELWGTLARGEVWTGHLTHRRKDGSLYEEDATISPVRDSSGNIVSFVGVMRDVTQLLLLEKQVRTAQKMEAVGTLAGGIAHDFNNVLTVIIGYGEMLKLRIANDPNAVSDLDEILRSAERASVLTRQLLTFARRQIIELGNLDLNRVVADLEKFLRNVTRENIKIKTSLAEGLSTIRADQGQVEQVLMNLSLNARDAMPGGGQLVVETQEEWVDEEYVKQYPYMKAGRYAVLSVSDTGIGMDEETRERIFEPFFTTKGPDKGTGLGLAVVYGIVKQHNGFIHVYSEPGKGTTFRIYFPAVDVPADTKVVAARGIIHGGNETILLAEDNESVRHLAEQTLISNGYKVLVACDGEEAVDIFRRHGKEIAIVVLDMVMPNKGGKQAYDEMIATIPGLKAIFMSGYSANAIHDSFVLHPGIPFLQKPFGPSDLARKVREVLGGE